MIIKFYSIGLHRIILTPLENAGNNLKVDIILTLQMLQTSENVHLGLEDEKIKK